MNQLLQQLLWQSMERDPRVAQIEKEVKESGMTAEEYFYKKAKEMGVNPESILARLR